MLYSIDNQMTVTDLLQKGQAALKTENYTEAIEFLEACCAESSEPRSQTYLKAQMGLVKAYHQTQQSEKAIALCHELAQNPNPKLQAWANQALQTCSIQPQKVCLTSEAAESIFEQASKLLRLRKYEEAIPLLEKLCDQTDATYPNHYQAKMLLVKAYQNHQDTEQAIALCQKLVSVDHNITQIWARNYLPMISPEIARSLLEGQTEKSEVQEEEVNLPKRSLEDFKDYCRQNLVADLKQIEKTRKEVLLPLAIVTAVFVIVLGLALKFTPALLEGAIASTQERCDQPVETVMQYKDGTIRPNVKAIDLDQLARKNSRRCRSNVIPRWSQEAIKVLSLSLFVVGGSAFLWIAFYTSSTEAYGRGFQRTIIEKIISFLDPKQTLTYFRGGDDAVVLSALQQSRLFTEISKSVYLKQDHCIAGKIGKTNLFFSEITFQKELPHTWITEGFDLICSFGRSSGSIGAISTLVFLLLSIVRGAPYCIGRIAKGQRIDFEHFQSEIVLNAVSRQPIFKGIFFISDFNRTFRGKTVILPNKLTSKVKFLNQHRGQPVKLEDPEFSKFFSVYSNDQIGARYVLSTSVMQRIVDFRKKANRDVLIALVDSQLYIAVPSEEDLFEPRLFKTMLSFNPMREYFETLQLMMSIVEDLNLNQRIWKL